MWIVKVISMYGLGQQSYFSARSTAGTPRTKRRRNKRHKEKEAKKAGEPTTCDLFPSIGRHGEDHEREAVKHKAGDNQVKDVVELSASDFHGKR